MTIEQAKSEIMQIYGALSPDKQRAIDTLVKIEPCEDAISREKTCDYIAEFINHEYSTQSECEMVEAMIDGIQHLPPVNPQEPKIGHWISHYDEDEKVGWYECDRCHTERAFKTKFCSNCGAKMVEPQESEVSNG